MDAWSNKSPTRLAKIIPAGKEHLDTAVLSQHILHNEASHLS